MREEVNRILDARRRHRECCEKLASSERIAAALRGDGDLVGGLLVLLSMASILDHERGGENLAALQDIFYRSCSAVLRGEEHRRGWMGGGS